MNDFSTTDWADDDFSRAFRERFEPLILDRTRHINIVRSFYRYYLKGGGRRVLDLGCGDGAISEEILKVDPSARVFLVDGSGDMIGAARERLRGFAEATFLRASFQELMAEDMLPRGFDFVLSSLAIHHLDRGEKEELFRYILGRLNKGGLFLIIDVVLTDPFFEEWYLELWREFVRENSPGPGNERDLEFIISRHRDRKTNKLDTIEEQLHMLARAGFSPVDCFYRFGVFAVFGARR